MKILFFTGQFPNINQPLEGIFNVPRAKGLLHKGHEVKAIVPIGMTPPEHLFFPFPKINRIRHFFINQNKIPLFEIIKGIEVYYPRWWWLPRRFCWYSELLFVKYFAGKQIFSLIDSYQPDVIITSWLHPWGSFAKYIKQRFDIPIISILEGSDILVLPQKYKGIQNIERIYSKYVDMVIFVSANMKENSARYFKVNKYKIIHNGFDSTIFNFKNVLSKNKNRKNIVAVGSLEVVKGFDILLKAIQNIGAAYNLIIIGDGSERYKYQDFINKNNLHERIQLLGYIKHNNIINYLRVCDIFCNPSRSEGLPTAPLEAMACGLPVVATRVGGLPEIIQDGFNGYLCEKEDLYSLESALIKAGETKWQNEKIASWAKENYSWLIWAEKMNFVINELVKSNLKKKNNERLSIL